MPRLTRCSASRSASRESFRQPSRHLERAIALQPASPDAHYHLGVALWYSGEKDRAVAELQQSVKLDPAAGESHAFLGTMLRERGDLPAARVSLQCAIALLPSSAAVYVDLGITYLRAGQLDPGDRAARSRAERAGAGAARAGLERCDRGASLDAVFVRADGRRRRGRRRTTRSVGCSAVRARRAATSRRRFVKRSAFAPTTPKRRTISAWC